MLQFPYNLRLEETGKANDLNYCLYHQNLGHATNEYYMLKSKIQPLIDAKIIQLKLEQKKVLANMATLMLGTNEFHARATPILAGKMVLVNYDPYNLKQEGLSPITTKKREIMWVHPNLLKGEQWFSPNCQKRNKGKVRICNAIIVISTKTT